MQPPIASPVLSTTEAWIFFVLIVAWTGFALRGLSKVIPFYVRWNDAYKHMLRAGINGERRLRARGLRRRAGFYVVILAAWAVVGVLRYVAPPSGLTSTLIGGAVVLSSALIMRDIDLEEQDLNRIGDLRAAQRSRASDPGHAGGSEVRG
jgi:hypothetical protein